MVVACGIDDQRRSTWGRLNTSLRDFFLLQRSFQYTASLRASSRPRGPVDCRTVPLLAVRRVSRGFGGCGAQSGRADKAPQMSTCSFLRWSGDPSCSSDPTITINTPRSNLHLHIGSSRSISLERIGVIQEGLNGLASSKQLRSSSSTLARIACIPANQHIINHHQQCTTARI